MPCWVVPAVAAELWGVSVEDVLARAAEGSLATKSDAGFLFVNVLPSEPTAAAETAPPLQAETAEAPPTFTILSDDELAALTAAAAPQPQAPATFVSVEIPAPPAEAEAPPKKDDGSDFVDEETPGFSAKDWRRVRSQTARTRRPPGGGGGGRTDPSSSVAA